MLRPPNNYLTISAQINTEGSLDKILSTRAVAIALDVSERTVRKLCEIGSLPHYRIGKLYRIRQSDLESYLRERYLGDFSAPAESTPKAY
jgi:excisionase family DNA binding protein